jgi:hypothetical protein
MIKTNVDDKRKHLEFAQGVINRLSSNTFLFKGWSITIIGVIFTAMFTTSNYNLLWLILGIALMFWFIDAYYLMLERGYRKLYDKIAETEVDKIDYKMGIKEFSKFSAWFSAFHSHVLLMFYGVVILIAVAFLIFNNYDISLIIKAKG